MILAMMIGCCGCDRCFMGQICCGVVKGCTFGGFGVWLLIDFWVCFISCLSKDKEIHTLGYNAVFEKSTIEGAFIGAILIFILHIVSNINSCRKFKGQRELQ